jgi:hypothetical protein
MVATHLVLHPYPSFGSILFFFLRFCDTIVLPRCFLSSLLLAIALADSTRVMHRPENYTQPSNQVDTAEHPAVHQKVHSRATTIKTQLA